jgi:hypothetical protein
MLLEKLAWWQTWFGESRGVHELEKVVCYLTEKMGLSLFIRHFFFVALPKNASLLKKSVEFLKGVKWEEVTTFCQPFLIFIFFFFVL